MSLNPTLVIASTYIAVALIVSMLCGLGCKSGDLKEAGAPLLNPRVAAQVQRCYRGATDVTWFDFSDFGPPSMSHSFLGRAWWAWDGEGHAFDEDEGVVLVAVHHGTPESFEEQELLLQPNRDYKCDVRLVSLDQALEYTGQSLIDYCGSPKSGTLDGNLRKLHECLSPDS